MPEEQEERNLVPGEGDIERWNEYLDEELYEIGRIEDDIDELGFSHHGLIDLDRHFRCIERKLVLVSKITRTPRENLPERAGTVAREQSVSALSYLEDVTASSISLDQKSQVLSDPKLETIRGLLEEIIAEGGGDFFSVPESLGSRSSKLVGLVERAVFKFTDRDRESSPVPGEIEEGQEEIVQADRITLPVSQAVLLLREEYIPRARRLLGQNPGDEELKRQLELLEEMERFYSRVTRRPRARPLIPERDYLTRTIAGHTRDGEMLVRMDLPSVLSSGNRYDRLLDEIKRQVIHTSAGKRISKDLDDEARYGPILRGVRRKPLYRSHDHLKPFPLYRRLAEEYPFLRRLEDREELKKLIHMAENGDREGVHGYLTRAVLRDRNLLWAGEPLELDVPEEE
ncbi:MAG: hypothetical protein ACLFRY_05465 [Spirochaetia bacterium]